MAKRKNKNVDLGEDMMVEAEEVLKSSGLSSEKNQKTLFGILAVLILLGLGYYLYQQFVVKPKQNEAVAQMYKAQEQFERDSFRLALTEPGPGYLGFLDIIDQFGGTKAGNLANYYAGISYLNLGQFEAAIDYLKSYKADADVTLAMKYNAMGDAYAELNKMDEALSYYKKALDNSQNDIVTAYSLMKLGMFYESQGNKAEAKTMYERIKKEYPKTPFATEIDKYLIRASS